MLSDFRKPRELASGCNKCIKKENETGMKTIECDTCGIEFTVPISSRVCRCTKCKELKQLEWNRDYMAKKRKCGVTREIDDLQKTQ